MCEFKQSILQEVDIWRSNRWI